MLIKLKDLILNHNWHTLPKNVSDSNTAELKSYDKIKNSLTYNNHHEVILTLFVPGVRTPMENYPLYEQFCRKDPVLH